jgi:Cullin family
VPAPPAEETLSYGEIRERLNLQDEEVGRALHSLACAKYKILEKVPPGKTISKSDSFRVNAGFTDRMRRIRVRVAGPSVCLCRKPRTLASREKLHLFSFLRARRRARRSCCRRSTRRRRSTRTWTRTGATRSMRQSCAP